MGVKMVFCNGMKKGEKGGVNDLGQEEFGGKGREDEDRSRMRMVE